MVIILFLDLAMPAVSSQFTIIILRNLRVLPLFTLFVHKNNTPDQLHLLVNITANNFLFQQSLPAFLFGKTYCTHFSILNSHVSDVGLRIFRPLSSPGTLWRHSKILRRCDTRRHGRSDDHKIGLRRVF